MEMQKHINEGVARYSELLKKLDSEGRLNDRLPNDGENYDTESEYADLVRYKKSLETGGSLAFMG